jgi:hypothetical protein
LCQEVGVYDTPGFVYHLQIDGSTVCLANGWAGVRIVSVAGASPTEPSGLDVALSPLAVRVAGGRAYVAAGDEGLRSVLAEGQDC